MAANDCLVLARSKIGYYAPADPQPGSEAGRWMAAKNGEPWLAGPSTQVWWCMCFASMCVYETGGTLPGGPSYNTDYTVNAARRTGQLVPVTQAQPGDLAIFDWNLNTATTDHVGIVEQRLADGRLVCIEGNTSRGDSGSQSAGNGVWRRTRAARFVRYVVRPSWGQPVTPPKQERLDEDGVFGPLSTSKLQAQLGTPVDGVISGQLQAWRQRLYGVTSAEYGSGGSRMVQALQRRLGVEQDGIIGLATIKALQARLGVTVDGWWGTDTSRALQRALNRDEVRAW